MNWVNSILTSSVGKKFVMGITGLFLCFFLVVHLAGNLLLWAGKEQYDHYALALHSQPVFLTLAEVFLYLAFGLHIYLAFVTAFENRRARDHRYAVIPKTKRQDRVLGQAGVAIGPDTIMFATGAIVLFFLIVHVLDFKFEANHRGLAGLSPYDKAGIILGSTFTKLVYTLGSVILGYHVAHGFQSAFQSLGLSHPRYTPWIKKLSIAFAFVVAIGFSSFVVKQFETPAPPANASAESNAPQH